MRDSAKGLIWAGSRLGPATSFMSDKFFVDTNIFVYAHDRAAGAKHERARALVDDLWRSGNGVLSTQVLQELCINLRRKTANPLSIQETRRLLQDYISWEIIVNTAESVIEALAIELRYKVSFWDALIIQAAAVSGATILYSEDLRDGQTFGPVRVLNPLKHVIPK
jgi:predicted nucleic acid-binding protein